MNYRANIYALKEQGVSRIVAWTGPGAINASLRPGEYVLPHDVIDHTHGRESSFFKGTGLGFIRQSPVFCPEMRGAVERAMTGLRLTYRDFGVYICTQGPRLETPAEIKLYRTWGADMVGMTIAPEVVPGAANWRCAICRSAISPTSRRECESCRTDRGSCSRGYWRRPRAKP